MILQLIHFISYLYSLFASIVKRKCKERKLRKWVPTCLKYHWKFWTIIPLKLATLWDKSAIYHQIKYISQNLCCLLTFLSMGCCFEISKQNGDFNTHFYMYFWFLFIFFIYNHYHIVRSCREFMYVSLCETDMDNWCSILMT